MTYHCYGCTRRTATYHASCEDYANDKKLAEKEREAMKGPTESVRLYINERGYQIRDKMVKRRKRKPKRYY